MEILRFSIFLFINLSQLFAIDLRTENTEPCDYDLGDAISATSECSTRSKFRTLLGVCNNINHKWWGVRKSPMLRLAKVNYESSRSTEHKKSENGGDLPNIRKITLESFNVPPNPNRPTVLTKSKIVNHFHMVFGQFLSHDLTQASGSESASCPCSKRQEGMCQSISISEDDKWLSNITECLKQTRKKTFTTSDECPGFRTPINGPNSWIDLSTVYGNSREEMALLRSFKNGLLEVTNGDQFRQLDFLPNSINCPFNSKVKCFRAGDPRVNENKLLMITHTIFMRLHNERARILSAINPSWEDERIFEEARHIAISEFQHVIYNEYLSVAIGDELMESFNLYSFRHLSDWEAKETSQKSYLDNGFFSGYDSNIDPRLAVEFNLAFRFGHAQIRDTISIRDDKYKILKTEELRANYFNSEGLFDEKNGGGISGYTHGMIADAASRMNNEVPIAIHSRLFQRTDQNGKVTSAQDLTSLDILRTRDFGAQSYVFWRKRCMKMIFGRTETINSFDDLKQNNFVTISSETISKWKSLFKNVNDIDLVTGGFGEKPRKNGIVGITFGCLLAEQFDRLKRGDRYWYENSPTIHPGAFSRNQLTSIRQTSLSRILCDVIENMREIQPKAFRLPDSGHKVIRCARMKPFDYSPWME
ncbi:hypothetical protein SNEBB_004586 [Seison nebaliae]|nr:hypothetical protein SNEBB_004586 [Seison nebaliae]